MTLVRRVLFEKRRVLLILGAALLVNVGVYVLVVYPLGVKSETAVSRAATAATVRQSAEGDMAAANALVSGKTSADQELATFYQKVVPANLDAARRMTYARLPALARKSNVKFENRRSGIDPQTQRSSRLGRLQTQLVVEGDYESLRQFLYELENTPDFIIIDQVALGQGETNKPITLSLEVSTYYRLEPNGT
jgi:hypothetical protein